MCPVSYSAWVINSFTSCQLAVVQFVCRNFQALPVWSGKLSHHPGCNSNVQSDNPKKANWSIALAVKVRSTSLGFSIPVQSVIVTGVEPLVTLNIYACHSLTVLGALTVKLAVGSISVLKLNVTVAQVG